MSASRLSLDQPEAVQAGVVGIGLMGSSIATCLLAAGHSVAAVTRTSQERRSARKRIARFLKDNRDEGLHKEKVDDVLSRLKLSEDYGVLEKCGFVAESIIEDLKAKRSVIHRIEAVVPKRALIGSNTSALPISRLQQGMKNPERIVGIHWGEPAHINKFMEVIRGRQTTARNARRAVALGEFWGKEPSLVRRDIRGFITNRVMCAMLREAFGI